MRIFAAAASVLLAALVAVAWQRYDRDLDRARGRISQGSALAETRCGRIEFASEGRGTPLLLVHGAGGGFDQALAFGRPLLDAGLKIVAPSRFGYLRTPAPKDTSAQAQADAHACLLDALGIGRIAVLGASAGAPSALQFCIRHAARCERLILLVPALYAPGQAAVPPPPAMQWVAEHVLASDSVLWLLARVRPQLLIRTMLATPLPVYEAASAAERARMRAAIDGVQPVSRRAAGLRIDAQVTSNLTRDALEQVQAPTLLISVEDDLFGTWNSASYTASQIAGARFVSYPSGGHLWLGHQDEVWREIADFVQIAGGN